MAGRSPTAAGADPVAEVLARLPGHRAAGAGWSARCPAHDDRLASLSITRGEGGLALLHCHAGCTAADVCRAIGLTLSDLFARPTHSNGHHNGNGHARRIVKTYDYVDPEGVLLYQKVRYEPKDFRQRRPVGNGCWSYTLGDVQRVLYRQPEVNDADPGEWVHLVEGEKAADALIDSGLVATCTCEGAGKWKPGYTEALRGRRVAVLVDNDDPGRAHGRLVADALTGTAAEVRVVDLPGLPPKGDAFDFLAVGGTTAGLAAAVEAAIPHPGNLADVDVPFGPDGNVTADPAADPQPPSPVIRRAVDLIAANPDQRPAIIHGLIRTGETLNLVSGPKTFKSHTVASLLICAAVGGRWLDTFDVEPGRVLLVDNELYDDTIAHRLRSVAAGMGVDWRALADRFDVVTLRGNLRTVAQLAGLFNTVAAGRYTLVALDAIYRMLPGDEGAENSNAVWAGIYNAIDRHAARIGCGFVVVHHTSKGVQGGKSITDVGAGAGAQSRAADCHMVVRPHEEPEAVVVEAEVRTFTKPPPVCCRWQYPLWRPDPTLNPEQVMRERGRGGRPRKDQAPAVAKPEPVAWTPDTFATAFVTADPKAKDVVVARAIKGGVTGRECGHLIALALDARLIHRHTKPGDRTVYLATTEPELFPRDTHARTPPTPPRAARPKKGRQPKN